MIALSCKSFLVIHKQILGLSLFALLCTCTTHIHTHTHFPVRQKAKEIIGFLQDDERLREARKAAKQARDKYVGYSSEDMLSRYSESPLLAVH